VAAACDQTLEALTSVFALLGKRWTGLILAVLMLDAVRYAELTRAVPGISQRMLSCRLAELAAADLISREVVEGPPLAVRYRLTAKGAALRPAMEELARWAEEHYLNASEPPANRSAC
jgi:DNA-binding HxlR family transcriptional regulator